MRKQLRAFRKISRSKAEKHRKRLKDADTCTPEKIFCYKNFIRSAKKSTKDVGWKASVQGYQLRAISRTYSDYKALREGRMPKGTSGREIAITERGKTRVITPIHIRDRVLQKTLCDNALVPVLSKKLIYDNGASLKGKGVSFTRKRIENHLKKAVKRFGSDFYILTYDVKNFFGSIPHARCRKILEKYFHRNLVDVAMAVIKNPLREKARKIQDKTERERRLRELDTGLGRGICLGSQESQILALVILNSLDHYIKEKLKRKFYVRYMDDGVMIAKTKEELKAIYVKMKKILQDIGMSFNEKKTRITKASKGFTFLKVKYHITKTGKIIRRLSPKGTARMRRKLKKFKRLVDAGEMSLRNVYDSMQSWMSHAAVAKSHKTISKMMKLYRKLFGGYGLSGDRRQRGREKHVLQDRQRESYRWSYIQ